MEKDAALNIIEQIVHLKAVIGYLGEKDQFRCWDTSFLGGTGQKFLEITFPRSALAAGIHSVTEAAKRLHDSRIGKSRVYHLFRMPAGTEQKIHQQLADLESSSILSPIKGKEIALKNLKALFESGLSAPEAPLQVGPEKKMLSARMPGWAEEFKPK